MSGSNKFDLPDVYRGFNFGFLPTAENIMTAKLFDFRDDVVFKAKVLDIQRKHLLAKQSIWQAINPSLYESDWVPNRLVTETSNNVNDAMISHARDFDGQILRQQWDKLLFLSVSPADPGSRPPAAPGPYRLVPAILGLPEEGPRLPPPPPPRARARAHKDKDRMRPNKPNKKKHVERAHRARNNPPPPPLPVPP
eukprot:jgi/Botrbrau1/13594/Bobra.0307s0013.1